MSEAGEALKAKIEQAKATIAALAEEVTARGGSLRDRVEDGLREAADALQELADNIADEDDEGDGAEDEGA